MFKKKENKEPDNNFIFFENFEEVNSEEDDFLSQDVFDYIYPDGIDVMSEKYINIDGTYVASILCFNVLSSDAFLLFDGIINKGEGIELYLKFVPKDQIKISRALTKYIGYSRSKKLDGENQPDIELVNSAITSGEYIRKRLAKGDEFYFFHPIIKVSAFDKDALMSKLRVVESMLSSKNILYKYANFKQLETFLTTVPGCKEDKGALEVTQRNATSSDLAGLYPFSSSSLTDAGGILVGINEHDNRPAIINQFNTDKYVNANVVILGTSGSGKTFTTQLITGRYRMKKIPVMMVCPFKGYEYEPLCTAVGGNYIKFATSGGASEPANINCMDIRPHRSLVGIEESYLAHKVKTLKIMIEMMVPTISKTEIMMLEKPIIKTYADFGITMDNTSIYEKSGDKVSFDGKIKEMPLLEHLIANMKDVPELVNIAKLMTPYISGSYSFFNKKTNIDVENLYTVADISDLPKDILPIAMFLVLELYLWRAKKNLSEYKVIVLDEIWKLTAVSDAAANYVLELYKIVRSYGCGIIGATQDITDLFILKDGYYGKGIINNSAIKFIMKSEPVGIDALKPVLKMTDVEAITAEKLSRGQGLVYAGNNHLLVSFKPFKTEERLMNTDVNKRREYEEERR